MGRKRFAARALVVSLTLGLIAAAGPGAGASSTEEGQFVSRINAERGARGLSGLTVKSDLVSVARRHSERMADDGEIYHNGNLRNEVDGWTVLGENVGVGPSVDDLHDAFMNSSGHRANILEDEYNQVGVGVVIRDGTIYVTEVFAQRAGSTTKTTTKKPSSGGSSAPRTTSPSSSPSTVRPASSTARDTASAPAPAPRRPARSPQPPPRNVDLLVRLIGMDSAGVDPATGLALGI